MFRRVAALRAEAGQRAPNEERRSSRRYPASLRVPVRLADGAGPTWYAPVRDLSTLGIGLRLPQEINLATLLEVKLQQPNGVVVRPVLARVVHLWEEDRCGTSCIVGCAFISELSEAELQLFHAEAIRPPAGDGRRWLRFPCNVETVCYTCDTVPGERRPARILNISPGGIGLLLPCQFPAGILLHFELPAGSDQPARDLLVRVLRVIEHSPGMWFLGCEFASQLGEEELRSLLRG
jgi:hypothetical protein